MTIKNISNEACSEKFGRFYVRLQNLPVSAGQKQIREFFSELTIPVGGISFHQNCAFVIFDNETEAAIAVSKDKELIDGQKVRISNAVLKDIRRTRVNEARRKLVFSPPEQTTMLKQQKRIRPTKVKDSSALVASKKFCPDEIESPMKNDVKPLLDVKDTEINLNKEILTKKGSRLPGENLHGAEAKPCSLVEKIPELRPLFEVPNLDESSLLLENNVNKNEVDSEDGQIVKLVFESGFLEKCNSVKNESKQLGESVSVQENRRGFRNEKVLKIKEEIFFTDENNSRNNKFEEKVTGQLASSALLKKVRDVTNKCPTKKTMKPTSVLTMNLFKMAYEGTVF